MVNRIKPRNGNLLLHFESVHVEKTEYGMHLEYSYELEMHQQIIATVISICPEKTVDRDDRIVSVDMLPGDKVILDYLAAQTALEGGNNNKSAGTWFQDDGKLYALVPAASVMAILRDGKLFPASGYVLAQEIDVTPDTGDFIVQLEEAKEEKTFKVHSVGSDATYNGITSPHLEPGDIVQTARFCAFPLEFPGHRFIDKDQLIIFEKHLVYAIAEQTT